MDEYHLDLSHPRYLHILNYAYVKEIDTNINIIDKVNINECTSQTYVLLRLY